MKNVCLSFVIDFSLRLHRLYGGYKHIMYICNIYIGSRATILLIYLRGVHLNLINRVYAQYLPIMFAFLIKIYKLKNQQTRALRDLSIWRIVIIVIIT